MSFYVLASYCRFHDIALMVGRRLFEEYPLDIGGLDPESRQYRASHIFFNDITFDLVKRFDDLNIDQFDIMKDIAALAIDGQSIGVALGIVYSKNWDLGDGNGIQFTAYPEIYGWHKREATSPNIV